MVLGKALRDSAVLVTGAASGLGRAIADDLSNAGATVVEADIAWLGQQPSTEGDTRVLRFGVDISDRESVAELAGAVGERLGALDAIVNNAAIDAPPGLAWEIDDAHWSRLIDVNLSGAWWVTRAFLPQMRERRHGRIVMISSLAARLGSARYSPAYAAAKAGLLGLTVGLAAQLEPDGVLCNAITPGATGTTGTPMTTQELDEFLAAQPLGIGGVEPVVAAVRYLLEPSGDWLSGTVLNVSGGQLRGI